MAEVYTFKFMETDFIYLGSVGEVLDLGYCLGKCLNCGEYIVLPDKQLPDIRRRIKRFRVDGKLGDEKLVNSIIFEIERVREQEKDTSRKLTKLVTELLSLLN